MAKMGVIFDWGWIALFRVRHDIWSLWLFNNRYLIRW